MIKRHVYNPPKGRLTGVFALIGGVLATIAVFIAIPISQKLNEIFQPSTPPPPEISVEPPEEQDFEIEPPPEDPEPEPEPEEMVEQANDLDFGLEVADLSGGTGGGFIMDVPSFGMKGGDDPFGSGDMDSAPVPTRKTQPVYPSSLLGKGIGGRVLVSCAVDTSGKVVSTTIKQSSGHPDLDKAAINAINKWAFKPGTRGGKKVKATCVVPFNFEVKKN